MTPRIDSSPYASPTADALPFENQENVELGRRARRALAFAFAPPAAIALGIGAFFVSPLAAIFFSLLIPVSIVFAIRGLILGARTSRALLKLDKAARPAGWGAAIAAVPVAAIGSAIGVMATMLSLMAQTRGRQLRVLGEVKLAPLAPDTAWTTPGQEISATPLSEAAELAEVADAWRKNGLTEHASVAAFARLSTELVALGAPPELIQGAHEDALDEMRHTTWCFDLARRLDGKNDGPREFSAARSRLFAFGPKKLRLAQLAVESLIDGALNEGISARTVGELAREVTDPKIKEMLQAIAADEGRHAAHGFEIVKWCVEEGGYAVQVALQSAIAALPAAAEGKKLAEAATDGRWEKFGIPSRAREDRAYAAAAKKLADRTMRLLYS